MKTIQKQHLLLVFGICVSIILTGCVPAVTPDSLEIANETREITLQTAIDHSPTPSPTKIRTATAAVLEKPVSTKTITPTSVPTLSAEQRKTVVSNYLLEDTSCNLPCWWGIMPGTTTWQEAEEQFHQWGSMSRNPIKLGQETTFHGFGGLDLEQIRQRLYLIDDEGIITTIKIETDPFSNPYVFQELWRRYSPVEIIRKYGQPDRIFVSVYDDKNYGRDGRTTYYFWLVYDEAGFFIRYMGFTNYDDIFRICPQFVEYDILSLEIQMQKPGTELSLTSRIDGSEDLTSLSIKKLEDVTDITPQEYYQLIMLDEQAGCFETPLSFWQE